MTRRRNGGPEPPREGVSSKGRASAGPGGGGVVVRLSASDEWRQWKLLEAATVPLLGMVCDIARDAERAERGSVTTAMVGALMGLVVAARAHNGATLRRMSRAGFEGMLGLKGGER